MVLFYVQFWRVVDDKENIGPYKGMATLLEKIEVVGSFPTFQFLFVLLTFKINIFFSRNPLWKTL
jgi:hypothetical protein